MKKLINNPLFLGVLLVGVIIVYNKITRKQREIAEE